jgi:hypothetical protein
VVQVHAEVSGVLRATFPQWEKIHFSFPARDALPPASIHWHNGPAPGSRALIEDLLKRKLDWGDAGEKKWKDHAGLIIVGTKGALHANGHNTVTTLLPEADWKDFKGPDKSLPRSNGHEREWLEACKGGPPAWSNFTDYGSPLTEFVLLGNVATQVEGRLDYDAAAGKFLNSEAANALVHREYRKGWEL